MNFNQASKNFLAQFSRERTSNYGELPRSKTLDAYRLHLERFAHDLDSKNIPIEALTVNQCKEWITCIAERSGQSNVNQALTGITKFLTYLTHEKLFNRDDLKDWKDWKTVQCRRVRSKTAFKYFTPDEYGRLFSAMETKSSSVHSSTVQRNRDIAFFGMMLFGFSRLGDLIRLPLDKIQYCQSNDPAKPDEFQIKLPEEIVKHHRDEHLFITEHSCYIGSVDIYQHLKDYHQYRIALDYGPSSPYFLTVKHELKTAKILNVSTLHRIFATYRKRAGIDKGAPHWLKHTGGEIGRQDRNITNSELSELLHHAENSPTSRRYTSDHVNLEHKRELASRAATAISKP